MDAMASAGRLSPEAAFASPFLAEFALDRGVAPTRPVAAPGFAPFVDRDSAFDANEADDAIEEVLSELRDDEFHEAVAFLAEETGEAVEARFQGEAPLYGPERERFARTYLAPLQFEADQYLSALQGGLEGVDLQSLTDDELDEKLAAFDPVPAALTQAGEEFIGKLVRKAKKAVRKIAKVAMPLLNPLLTPVLGRLRKLITPLLERVLRFAIGRLPEPLRPVARTLADRLLSKAAPVAPTTAPATGQPVMAAAVPTDTNDLADSFDLNLAEAIAFPKTLEVDNEGFGTDEVDSIGESHELSHLADARRALMAGLRREGSEEDVALEIEQFAPVLLAALRVGLRLVGRPRVVSLLAGYLGKMIARYVGPAQSGPLSRAIVDAGLRLVSLEAPTDFESGQDEAGTVAATLAGVVEDTVRRLAESPDYVFENDDLTEVAIADSFGEAAATYFPQDQIRGELQLAPSLGAMFLPRGQNGLRAHAKYGHVPEVSISARAASALPAFGGGDLAAAIRAANGRFPLRARLHIYQAGPGATAGSILRADAATHRRGLGVFPLTRRAAGTLLREPGLGARTPARFLKSRHRLGVGQRIYVLEPLDPGTGIATLQGRRIAPGKAWLSINPRKARITLGFYLSEPEAQDVAQTLRANKGVGEVLRRLTKAYLSFAQRSSEAEAQGETLEADEEGFTLRDAASVLPPGFAAVLRERIAAWAMPALAEWLQGHADAFQAAVAHPDPGIKLRIRLTAVPGLDRLGRGGGVPTLAAFARMLTGKPAATINVTSGAGRR